MKSRIITGLGIVLVLVALFFLYDTPAFTIVFTLAGVIGEFEMLRCQGFHKNAFISVPLYIAAVVMPASQYFFLSREGKKIFPDINITNEQLTEIYIYALLILLLYMFALSVLSRGKIGISEIFSISAASLYIIGAFTCIVYLSLLPYGKHLWILVFIGSWVTDVFAYVTGRIFGKHKLIPEVSPKKTIEGSIGGAIFGTFAVFLYVFLFERIADLQDVNYVLVILAGVFMSFLSQIGDLVMSVIKRHYNIKDYGKILPGHGGILDRFDSSLSVAIVLAAFNSFTLLLK